MYGIKPNFSKDRIRPRDAPRVKNPGGAGSNAARRRSPAAPSDPPKSGGAAAPPAPPLPTCQSVVPVVLWWSTALLPTNGITTLYRINELN